MMPPVSDDGDDDGADEQRVAGAVHQARKDVAADGVGAEEEAADRRRRPMSGGMRNESLETAGRADAARSTARRAR